MTPAPQKCGGGCSRRQTPAVRPYPGQTPPSLGFERWNPFACQFRGFARKKQQIFLVRTHEKSGSARLSQLRAGRPSHTIENLNGAPIWLKEGALTCPSCGNDRNFQVKTVQMHVVHLDNDRVEVSDEGRPIVLEVLCDECETALSLEEFGDEVRREVLLTIGAR